MVKKSKDLEVIENINSESDDEEITLSKQTKKQLKNDIQVQSEPAKPGKEKKPYVLTPARKAQFEKARQVREENLRVRNEIREESAKKHEEFKNELLKKKEFKSNKKKVREIKELIESDSSSSEEEAREVIVKKKKAMTIPVKKPKKKVVYVSSSSESSSDESVEVKPNTRLIKNKITQHQKKSDALFNSFNYILLLFLVFLVFVVLIPVSIAATILFTDPFGLPRGLDC